MPRRPAEDDRRLFHQVHGGQVGPDEFLDGWSGAAERRPGESDNVADPSRQVGRLLEGLE